MKIKTSISIGLTIILITVVSILVIPALKAEGNQNFLQTEIPVVFKPLKVGNEIVPVEIQCKRVIITRPDNLDNVSCILVNRTNKSIRSVGYSYSIVTDSSGNEERISHLNVLDTFIHPDLAEEKKPIQPGEVKNLAFNGVALREAVIKRLEVEPVYLEFADGATAGFGGKSVQLIANLREGAARFKNSLRQEYLNRGRSAQAILPLLEENAPLGSEMLSFDQRAGAKAYRRALRKKHQKKGIAAVNDVLNR